MSNALSMNTLLLPQKTSHLPEAPRAQAPERLSRKQSGSAKSDQLDLEDLSLSEWLAGIDWGGAPTNARSRQVPAEEMTACSVPVPGEVHRSFKSAALGERNSMTDTLIALMHTYAGSFSSQSFSSGEAQLFGRATSEEAATEEAATEEAAGRMEADGVAPQPDLFDPPALRGPEWRAAIAWEAAPTGAARIRRPKSRLRAMHVKVPLRFHLHFKRLARRTDQTVTDTFVALMYTYALAKGKL